jgi:hypothetical protein
MAPFNPVNDPLGQLITLQQQAQEKRFGAAVDNPSTQVGPLPDPNWDAYFGAVNETGAGKPVNFTGGPSPEGSNQLTGFQPPEGTSVERYDSRGMHVIPGSTSLRGLQSAIPTQAPPNADITSDGGRPLFYPNAPQDATTLYHRQIQGKR